MNNYVVLSRVCKFSVEEINTCEWFEVLIGMNNVGLF